MVQVEYELILYAARDHALAREFVDYEHWMEARLAASLEALGAPRPIDAARTLIDQVRGFELERLIRTDAQFEDQKRRLRLVMEALINHRQSKTPASRQARRARESSRSRRTHHNRGGARHRF